MPRGKDSHQSRTSVFIELPPGLLAFGDRLDWFVHGNDGQSWDRAVLEMRYQAIHWSEIQEWAANDGLDSVHIGSIWHPRQRNRAGLFDTPMFSSLDQKVIDRLIFNVESPNRPGNVDELAHTRIYYKWELKLNGETSRMDASTRQGFRPNSLRNTRCNRVFLLLCRPVKIYYQRWSFSVTADLEIWSDRWVLFGQWKRAKQSAREDTFIHGRWQPVRYATGVLLRARYFDSGLQL